MKLEHLTLKLDVIQTAQFRQIARLTEIIERPRAFSGNLHCRVDDHDLFSQVLLQHQTAVEQCLCRRMVLAEHL